MADTKISALSALTAAGTATDDEIAIVDTSVTTTKKQTIAQARISFGPQLGTEQASTSGTSIDFTGIPSGVKRVTVNFVGVSTDSTSAIVVQIGDAGGVETSGYLGAGALLPNAGAITTSNSTASFIAQTVPAATTILHGTMTLTLVVASTNTWAMTMVGGLSDTGVSVVGGGSKSLSATLDRVRITTAGGTANFDAGTINITYE